MVEVNVAVTSGLACERVLFGGAGIAKLLGSAAPPHECPTRVSRKSALQEYPARVCARQECHTRVSQKSDPKSVLQVLRKRARQECLTRVSHKSVSQECRTRVFGVFRRSETECHTRVSYKSDKQ